MSVAWPKVTFDEAPLQIIDGDRGKNYPKQDEFLEQGHCLFLNTGNVTKSGFKFGDCQFITEQKDNVLRKGKLAREDVIMTTRGTIGNVAYFNRHVLFENIRINSGMVIFRTDTKKLLPSFLYQYLRSDQFNRQVNSLRSGAAQPQLPIRDIKVIELPLPSIPQQEAISDLVSKYDDLIENNKRRIELLEESARQLYKEWFVRFRFPGHEHVKIIDGVPDGWEKSVLDKHIKFSNGKALKKRGDGDCPVYGANGIINKTEKHLFDSGVVVGRVGAYCGSTMLALSKFWGSDNTIIAQCAHDKIGLYFLYFMLTKLDLNRFAGGAAQPLLTQTNLKKIEALFPAKTLCGEFDEFARDIFTQVNLLISQNEKLTKARDLLLPKLMSGEVVV